MKAQLIFAITLSLLAGAAHAGPAARTAVTPEMIRKSLTENERTVREVIYGKGRADANGLAAQALKIADEKIISRLELRADEKANLRSALVVNSADAKSTAQVERRLDALTAIISARHAAKEWQKKDQIDSAEAESIQLATVALTRTLANSIFSRTKTESSRLTKEEMADASLALERLESLPESIVKMERSERDSYTAVEMKRNELLETGKFTGEEALVEAIIAVKKVSKEDALKIVRKLKDCV